LESERHNDAANTIMNAGSKRKTKIIIGVIAAVVIVLGVFIIPRLIGTPEPMQNGFDSTITETDALQETLTKVAEPVWESEIAVEQESELNESRSDDIAGTDDVPMPESTNDASFYSSTATDGNLPKPAGTDALWGLLDGTWFTPHGYSCGVSFYYYQDVPYVCFFEWDSDGFPEWIPTGIEIAGEKLVNITVQYGGDPDDEYFYESYLAMTPVYQIDYSGVENGGAVNIRSLTQNEDWTLYIYGGATFEEAYERYNDWWFGDRDPE